VRVWRIPVVLLMASAVLVIAGCGSSGSGETTLSNPNDPQELAGSAGFQGVNSGELELALEIDSQGKEEEVNMRIIGSFLRKEGEELPQVDGGIESNGKLFGRSVDFFGGLTLLPDRIVDNYETKVHQPDDTTFQALTSAFEEAQEEGTAGDLMACWEAAAPIELSKVIKDLSFEGKSAALDGKPTWVAGGDLDVEGVIDALVEMSKDPECGAQLEALAPHLVEELAAAKRELAQTTREARLVFSVDKHGVIRTMSVDWILEPKQPKGEEIEVEFDLRLNQVNEIRELPRPHGYTPFEVLLKQFGLDLETVREADGAEIVLGVLEVIGQGLTGRSGS
jgi:hypothetical protein